MANLFGFPNHGQNLFGFGLGGFINGEPIGNNQEHRRPGFANQNGLPNLLQQNLQPSTNPLLQRLNQIKPTTEEEREEPSKKKDQLDVSDFAKKAAREALENSKSSPRAGQTQQVFVSEDGRFEATIDLQKKSDGTFDLDLAVKFAQSSAISAGQASIGLLPQGEDAGVEQYPAELQFSSLKASAERFTSYEQILETRGFQANIFFEESKRIAFQAEQTFDSSTAAKITNVSQEVAREFTLNISIQAESLEDFNSATESLLQFDDTGTLEVFLNATRNVLESDSENLNSFLDATQSLVNSAREHISSKLNNFFTGVQEQFGGSLEDIGFTPDFLQNTGDDVQKDLDSFFKVTNNFFENLLGKNGQIQNKDDVENEQLRVLDENLKELREQREEKQKREENQLVNNELSDQPISENNSNQSGNEKIVELV